MSRKTGFHTLLNGRNVLALATIGLVGSLALGSTLPFTGKATAEIHSTALKPVKPYANAPSSFADLVDKVRPSVVSIYVKGKKQEVIQKRSRPFGQRPDELPFGRGNPEFDPFREFFKRFGGQGQQPIPKNAEGSGFIISEDGYVVTNQHVVKDGEEFKVTLDDGEQLEARLIGSDERTDLALLKIKSNRKFKAVKMADNMVRVGEWVLAVGNPFGLGGTVTAGIVSAHGRPVGQSPYDYLQIDAAVNRGNSGGPAFNMKGEVVGVNTAIYSPSGGNVGIAFAIPSPVVHKIVNALKDAGSVKRGWLGIRIQDIGDDLAKGLDLEDKRGALVIRLEAGGPALKSDLKAGDVIINVNGTDIEDVRDLMRQIGEINPNEVVDLVVNRQGKEKNISVKLGTFPTGKQLAAMQKDEPALDPTKQQLDQIGLSLSPAREMGKGDIGVVITEIDPNSDASLKGLKVGDVIVEVNGKPVNFPHEVNSAVVAALASKKSVVLVRMKDGPYHGLKLQAPEEQEE